jgi:hypothetical protein
MTERSQPWWWWLENAQLAMCCGLIGGGGRDGTQVSFTCSGKTQLEYRWGRKASACWRPFLGARLLTRGGSPLVEGGFPFSVETDEFEEEVQGGGERKAFGKISGGSSTRIFQTLA